jgi:hypothetical protein
MREVTVKQMTNANPHHYISGDRVDVPEQVFLGNVSVGNYCLQQ